MALETIKLNSETIELPAQQFLDRFTSIDELLKILIKLQPRGVAALATGGLDIAEQRRIAETGQWVPYAIKPFALDTARTNEKVTVEGDFVHAWTDGDYEGIGVRFNNLNNDLVYFQRRNPIAGFRFWNLYLTHTAQAGKTLDLMIGREASAYSETAQITSIMENKLSAVLDSTTTALAGAATYTGAQFGLQGYAKLIGSCYADQDGTLYIEQSWDGTNYDAQQLIPYAASDLTGFAIDIVAPYGRIRFTNGAAAQATFRLYVGARRV